MQDNFNQEYEFSFHWEIEDFSLCPLKRWDNLSSPSFTVSTLGATKWHLVFYPEGTIDPAYTSLYLWRESGNIKQVIVNFKLGLGTAGSFFRSRFKMCRYTSFKENDSWGYARFLKREELKIMLEQSCARSIAIRCDMGASNIKAVKSIWNENIDFQNLSDSFLNAYKNEQFADIVLHCEGSEVVAHRCILEARLPKLSLQLGLVNNENMIVRCNIVDMSLPVLKCILFYAYTGKLNCPLSEIPPDLFKVAIRYELWDLIQKMKTYPSFYSATTLFNVEHESVSWKVKKECLLKNNNLSLVRIIPSVSLHIDSIVITCNLKMDPKSKLVETGSIGVFLNGFGKKFSVLLSCWITVSSSCSTLFSLYDGKHLFTDHDKWEISLDISTVSFEYNLDLICELDFCDGISSSTIREGWISSKGPVSYFNDFSKLSNNLSELLSVSFCSDFAIIVGNLTFPVHAFVLAARSSVFNRMLQCDMMEKRCRQVVIQNLRPKIVQLMLSYMYSGTIRDLKYNEAFELYEAADKYDISVLKERCRWFLMSSLNVQNAKHLLNLAYMHSDHVMMNHAVKLLDKNHSYLDLGNF